MGDVKVRRADGTTAGEAIALIWERMRHRQSRAGGPDPGVASAGAVRPFTSPATDRAHPPRPRGRIDPSAIREAVPGLRRKRQPRSREPVVVSALWQCGNLPPPVLIGSFFLNLLGLALPLAMLQIYDRILPNQSTETLLLLAIGLAVALLLEAALKVLRSYVMGWNAVLSGFHSERDAVIRLLKTRQDVVETEPPGTWIDAFDALAELHAFQGGHSRLILVDLPLAAIFLIVTAVVGGFLVLVPITMILGFGTLAALRGRALRTVLSHRSDQDNKRYDFLVECLMGIHTIKGLAMEPQMQRRFERLQKATAVASHRTILLGSKLQTLGNLFANLTMISVVTVGALMVMAGQLSIGALACCSLLSARLTQPVLRGIGIWTELQNVELAEQRALTFQELHVPVSAEAAVPEVHGAVSISKVSHWYASPANVRLVDISLEIAPGEFIGIRGEDGSGRSTLAALILGDAMPSRGTVRIDGRDASGPDQVGLRRHIGYVPASPVAFEGTVLENITMFRTGDHVEAARRAARLIGLEDDIHHLPAGYDTPLGRGVTEALASGFLQRITIARALAMEPRILILDEANTLLDFRCDRLLREGLERLRGEVTTLLISNRPSLLALADRAFELRDFRLRAVTGDSVATVPDPVAPAAGEAIA